MSIPHSSHGTGTLAVNKGLIRKEVLSLRDSIGDELKKAKDHSVRERLLGLPEFKASHAILLYVSFRSEVDTLGLIQYAIGNGKAVVLPKVDKQANDLILYEIKDMGELAPGCFGIPEPFVSGDRRRDVEAMDLIIVPGVAFDEQCNRLGYGKGFYDKLLRAKRSPAVALSFEEQIVPLIPAELHDIGMDKIVTDKRIIGCHG